MRIQRLALAAAVVTLVSGLAAPHTTRGAEDEPGRIVVEVVVDSGGNVDFVCSGLPCLARCRDVSGQMILDPGQFANIDGNTCNFTLTDGTVVDEAMLVMADLLDLLPEPELGPDGETEEALFREIINQNTRSFEASPTSPVLDTNQE